MPENRTADPRSPAVLTPFCSENDSEFEVVGRIPDGLAGAYYCIGPSPSSTRRTRNSRSSVDLDALRRAAAGRDLAVVERARAAEPDRFEHTLRDGDPPLGEAVRRIVAGEAAGRPPSHQYGYALRLLCEVEGEWPPDDDAIGDLGPLGLGSPFERPRLPLDIPANRDFPFVSYLDAAEVKVEAERLAALELSHPGDEGIEEAREAYAACLARAAEQGKAVVCFYS